jgi:hypothetical protein
MEMVFRALFGVPSIRMKPMAIIYYVMNFQVPWNKELFLKTA